MGGFLVHFALYTSGPVKLPGQNPGATSGCRGAGQEILPASCSLGQSAETINLPMDSGGGQTGQHHLQGDE
jgi:hypothetical protein